MVSVVSKPGESPEQLLKRFRKKVQRERVLSDIRKKRFFLSNSEKRRIALRKAKRRERNRQRRKQRRRRRY
ncbi:MAG: 30S ribosomal protein S21 [Anaerolineae bacterium]